MDSAPKTARVAGALYFLSAVTAGAPLIYVSSNLIVSGNAEATANKILASEMQFRAAMVCELIGAILFIFMVQALYQLLCRVNRTHAILMVVLVLASVPITFLNVINETAALTLLHGASFLSVFDKSQRDAMALLFLTLHEDGVNLANIFWGLWLFPFGLLVIKSRFIPWILGVLLLANGLALTAVSLTTLLLPSYLDVVNRFALIPELGELWMMLWLLIKGVKAAPSASAAA